MCARNRGHASRELALQATWPPSALSDERGVLVVGSGSIMPRISDARTGTEASKSGNLGSAWAGRRHTCSTAHDSKRLRST